MNLAPYIQQIVKLRLCIVMLRYRTTQVTTAKFVRNVMFTGIAKALNLKLNLYYMFKDAFKLKIQGELDSPINRIRTRINNRSFWYRFKLYIKVRLRLILYRMLHFKKI